MKDKQKKVLKRPNSKWRIEKYDPQILVDDDDQGEKLILGSEYRDQANLK